MDKSGIENKAESVYSLGKMLWTLKLKIFIEFDDVSCEQDDRGVGQTKLTEGLEEQEKKLMTGRKKMERKTVNN